MKFLSSLKNLFHKASLLSVALSLLLVSVALAASGDLDTTFSGDGLNNTDFGGNRADGAYAVAIQEDGKIVVVGYHNDTASTRDFAIARYNANGSLDATFSGDGRTTVDFAALDNAYSVVIQPNGKILVSGGACDAASTACVVAVARLNSNGALDATFSGDGKATATAIIGNNTQSYGGLALQPNGKIVVGGMVDTGGGVYDFAVFRFNANGALDTTFSGDGKFTISFGAGRNETSNDLILDAAGKIVIVGYSANAGQTSSNVAVARVTPGGALDPTFSGDGRYMFSMGATAYAFGNSVVIDANNKIVIGGTKNDGVGNAYFLLARLNPNGTFDATFKGGGRFVSNLPGNQEYGRQIVLDGSKILVVGESFPSASYDFTLARYNSNGVLDTSFSTDGHVSVEFGLNILDSGWAMAVDSNGNYVLVGATSVTGNSNFGVMRILP